VISIPSYSGGDPILVKLLVDASERSSVERFGHTSNDCEHLKKSNLVVEMDLERRIPNPSTFQVYFRDPNGAKIVAVCVDTKLDEAIR